MKKVDPEIKRDRRAEYMRRYYAANKERLAAAGKEYRARKPRNKRRPLVTITDIEAKRFMAKLVREESTGCLLWQGTANDSGHGRVRINGSLEYVHRVAWVLAGKKLDESLCVLHNCPGDDNPRCCEVAHLYQGTRQDNGLDAAIKQQHHKNKKGMPRGVYTKTGKVFYARVVHRGIQRHLGSFSSAEEASAVVEKTIVGWLTKRRAVLCDSHVARSWGEL